MKAPKYVLVASGHITAHPRMNLLITAEDIEFVREECKQLAAQLAKVGYHGFHLYDVSGNQADVYVETYYVSIPEPIVTVREH